MPEIADRNVHADKDRAAIKRLFREAIRDTIMSYSRRHIPDWKRREIGVAMLIHVDQFIALSCIEALNNPSYSSFWLNIMEWTTEDLLEGRKTIASLAGDDV